MLLKVGKTLCYEMSKAPTEGIFNKYMADLKEIKPVTAEALNKKPHKLWANYADRGNMTWNQSTSNFSESTNSMLGAEVWITTAQYAGACGMIDHTATLSCGQDVHAGSDNMIKRVYPIRLVSGNLKRRKSRQLPLCFPCCVEYADQGQACPPFAGGHRAANCIQAQRGSRATGDGRWFNPFCAV